MNHTKEKLPPLGVNVLFWNVHLSTWLIGYYLPDYGFLCTAKPQTVYSPDCAEPTYWTDLPPAPEFPAGGS